MGDLDWPREGRHILAGGTWMELEGAEAIPAISPIDEQVVGYVAAARASDVDRAVERIRPAVRPWAALGAEGRVPYLKAFADAILAHADELAELDVVDGGLPARTAAFDVNNSTNLIDFYCRYATTITGQTYSSPEGTFAYTVREPYGIVARITPFNHPTFFPIIYSLSALLAGNVVIVKPAEQTSLSALAVAEIARQVFPAGVYNTITGYGQETGAALVAHPAIPRIGFTGSVPTGQRILEGAAAGIKHVTLELGGKNPLIVGEGIDPELAATAAVQGMNFTQAGQSCASTSRVLVHESLYDQVVTAMAEKMQALVVGDPRQATTDCGPVCFKAHYDRVLGHIESGNAEGAKLVVGGGRPAGVGETGYYIEPTLFAEVTEGMRIATEEIFGPVVVAMRYETAEDAVRIANGVSYGLTSKVLAATLDQAMEIGRQIEAGTTVLNTSGIRPWGMPFGGYKMSGLGKELCTEELLSYTREKSVFAGV